MGRNNVYKDDGTQWYNYFAIRLDQNRQKIFHITGEGGYYISWRGRASNPFNRYFNTPGEAREYIMCIPWRQAVDAEFEKEVLGEE